MGKNKKPQGRSGAKQKSKARQTPRSTPRSRQPPLVDDWEDDSPLRFRGFAGSSNPRAHPSAPAQALRRLPIAFVSGEGLRPTSPPLRPALDDSDDNDDEDEEEIDDDIEIHIVEDEPLKVPQEQMARMYIERSTDTIELDPVQPIGSPTHIEETQVQASSSEPLPFFVDTVGDPTLAPATSNAKGKQPAKRAPSPTPSDSSDEVVLFHGRSNQPTTIHDPVQPALTRKLPVHGPPPSKATSHAAAPVLASKAQGWGAQQSIHDSTQKPGDTWSPAPADPYWRKGNGNAVPRPDLAPSAEELRELEEAPPHESKVRFAKPADDGEEANHAGETVGQLQADWRKVLQEKKRFKKLGFDDDGDGKISRSSRRGKRGRKRGNRSLRSEMATDDEDSEAAYDDYMDNLRMQLDEEERDNGEALVAHLKSTTHSAAIGGDSLVVDGKVVDEDEVLPQALAPDFVNDGSDWESSEDSVLNPASDKLSDDASIDASDLEDDLTYTEQQQWEDELDLRRRRVERMDDEKIVRLLAKQEEFGMDADEVILENGDFPYTSDEGYGDVRAARAGLTNVTNFTHAHQSNKQGMRRTRNTKSFTYPDASLMADTVEQYGENGFDIMDFDRPSLRPTKKGRKGKLPAELEALSDEDLKVQMADSWEKDRQKKREKKLEREELRTEGLLGSAGRKGRANLSQKYPLGMDMKQVWHELRAFLQDEDLRERAFPPMDKVNRKALHEVAVALNLNSKSQGAGRGRFPIIYKTARTSEFSEDMFERVIQASSRGFLTNHAQAKRISKQAGRGVKAKGRGGGLDAATVRNGEIVGNGAAEIGKENFGHRMMQKMGWAKGMGLGKDGAGSLTPVEQIMRRGTAGLG